MEDAPFRLFVKEAKERATHFGSQTYVAADVRNVILDLQKIIESFERMESEQDGMSADARLLKRKIEQLKMDSKLHERRVTALKEQMSSMIDFVIALSPEIPKMPPDVGARVRAIIEKMAKHISDATKF